MKTIWKFHVGPIVAPTIVRAPRSVQWLTAQVQDTGMDNIMIWGLLDPHEPMCDWNLFIIGTGWTIEDTDRVYIGTVQCAYYVWHIFAKLAEEA
jgi:hypothetical protein